MEASSVKRVRSSGVRGLMKALVVLLICVFLRCAYKGVIRLISIIKHKSDAAKEAKLLQEKKLQDKAVAQSELGQLRGQMQNDEMFSTTLEPWIKTLNQQGNTACLLLCPESNELMIRKILWVLVKCHGCTLANPENALTSKSDSQTGGNYQASFLIAHSNFNRNIHKDGYKRIMQLVVYGAYHDSEGNFIGEGKIDEAECQAFCEDMEYDDFNPQFGPFFASKFCL